MGIDVISVFNPPKEEPTSECWYQENWYDEDLIEALINTGIPASKGNIEKLKTACNGIFDDKSERNSMIKQKAEEVFN